jgi:hypothetical protein
MEVAIWEAVWVSVEVDSAAVVVVDSEEASKVVVEVSVGVDSVVVVSEDEVVSTTTWVEAVEEAETSQTIFTPITTDLREVRVWLLMVLEVLGSRLVLLNLTSKSWYAM